MTQDIHPVNPRVRLAAERTLLAWVRTGLALMGFGFVVARFGLFMREMAAVGHASWSQWIGVALVVGIAVNGLAAFEHVRLIRKVERGEADPFPRWPLGVVVTLIMVGLGVAMVVYLCVSGSEPLPERSPTKECDMDRRELFGAVGAGLTLGRAGPVAADDHGGKKEGADKLMASIGNHHLFFCGFHVAKKDPKSQVTAMHYCGMRGEGDHEMHQCLLYDSVGQGAKLLGVEYIVSDKLFQTLPAEEKKFWHPHTYEVLSGGLVAPAMGDEEESKFMKTLLTTWGKTWHTWPDPTTPVPMGEPLLMWALMGDGQEDKEMVAKRDKQFGVSTAKVRAKRVEAIGLEVPQVPPPKSVETVGRQWTASGEDKPTPRKK